MELSKPDDLKLDYYELLVTENCNSQCRYCFDNHFQNRVNQPENSKAWAQVEMIPDVLGFIDKTRASNKMRIHYIGGEPLLNFKFMKASADAIYQRFGPNIEFSINTNIVSLNEEKISFLVGYKFGITTSIDGIKPNHDRNRGAWDKVVKNLVDLNCAYIDRYGPDHHMIGTVYVIDADDDKVFEGYEFLRNLGANPSLSIDFDSDWTDDAFERYKTQYLKIVSKYRLDTVNPMNRYIRNLTTDRNNFCITHNNNVTINPQGKLFFCHRLTPKSYELADDFPYYYGDIWKGYINTEYYKTVAEIVSNTASRPECKDCEHARFCLGNCLGVHFTVNKDYVHINKNVCKFIAFWHGLITQSGIIRSENNDQPTAC